MIVNPDKYQGIVLKKSCRRNDSYALNINNHTINSENFVKLLNLWKRASKQLNAIGRIQKYMSFQEIEMLLNSFVLSNFNYCPFVWHFCYSKLLEKLEERALIILYNDSISDHNQLLNK